MHFLLLIILSVLDKVQKTCIDLIYISNFAYIANKLGFSYLATILDATLDLLARHHLFQFMPTVSYSTDYTEHFDI